jgi:hypothetical protein
LRNEECGRDPGLALDHRQVIDEHAVPDQPGDGATIQADATASQRWLLDHDPVVRDDGDGAVVPRARERPGIFPDERYEH